MYGAPEATPPKVKPGARALFRPSAASRQVVLYPDVAHEWLRPPVGGRVDGDAVQLGLR